MKETDTICWQPVKAETIVLSWPCSVGGTPFCAQSKHGLIYCDIFKSQKAIKAPGKGLELKLTEKMLHTFVVNKALSNKQYSFVATNERTSHFSTDAINGKLRRSRFL